jgi:hypothetical protein
VSGGRPRVGVMSQLGPRSISAPAPPRWFHGKISGQEAVQQLQPPEDGLFLVRESARHPGDYVLCVSFGRDVIHYRVLHRDGHLTIDEAVCFCNLMDMVEVPCGDRVGPRGACSPCPGDDGKAAPQGLQAPTPQAVATLWVWEPQSLVPPSLPNAEMRGWSPWAVDSTGGLNTPGSRIGVTPLGTSRNHRTPIQRAPQNLFCIFSHPHGNQPTSGGTQTHLPRSCLPHPETTWERDRFRGALPTSCSPLPVPQHYSKDKGPICTKLVKPKRKQGTKSAEEELAKGREPLKIVGKDPSLPMWPCPYPSPEWDQACPLSWRCGTEWETRAAMGQAEDITNTD